jgi:hypothetical protein
MGQTSRNGGNPDKFRKMAAVGAFGGGVVLVGWLMLTFGLASPQAPSGPAGKPPTDTPTAVSQPENIISKKAPAGFASPQVTPTGLILCHCAEENGVRTGKIDCEQDGVVVSSVVDTVNCPPPTEAPTTCYCEVKDNAWDGVFICVDGNGNMVSSAVDTKACPPPVCGNGAIEGNEQCDGNTCSDGGACRNCNCAGPILKKPLCTCEFTATADGGIQGHCAENPARSCTASTK